MNRKDLKILVIYGGISSEREVSLRSGAAVCAALKRGGYRNVSLFDLTRQSMGELLRVPIDLAFLALHGQGGEDGCIQGMLELAGIPYTGSSVETSANCMNKIRTKELLDRAQIPTPRFLTVYAQDLTEPKKVKEWLEAEIGYPMVLKAPNQGSSIGVVIVKDENELTAAINEVLRYGDSFLAEEFADGIELTLPILGNGKLTVLPIVEITSENEFYDYGAKYTQGMCHHILPARISEAQKREIEEIGKKAYRLLACEGLSRIDFILDRVKGPMLIEINTLPGMTEMSLFPDSAAYAGISFEELVDRIVLLALEKEERKNRGKQ